MSQCTLLWASANLALLNRSGDKSSDCNVGFFVRHDDEYEWLRSLLSLARIKELLAQEYKGGQIDRFELPNLKAVHFLLRDHLDRGANSSSSYDILGKQGTSLLQEIEYMLTVDSMRIPTKSMGGHTEEVSRSRENLICLWWLRGP